MAKIYFKKAVNFSKMQPKKETVSFLLQFSKALSYLKVDGKKFEIISN